MLTYTLRKVTIGIILLSFFMQLTPLFAQETSSFHLDAPHKLSAEDIADALINLNKKYPEYTYLQTIGYSHDQRPIMSLILTQNASYLSDTPSTPTTSIKHYLFEAGLHAREVVNPAVLIAIIEDYLIILSGEPSPEQKKIEELLSYSVLHFIPLSNPDGFNLSKFGRDTLTTSHAKKIILRIRSKSLMYLKANANGVDLNRNFPDTYYNVPKATWVNIWSQKRNQYNSSIPSLAYYFGSHPNSEPETQALTSYISRYPFNAVLSFHSRGEVIFWSYWMHSKAYNAINFTLAQRLATLTGYSLTSGSPEGASSGYMGDYVANTHQVPALTIETLPVSTVYNTTNASDYAKVYKQLVTIPIETMLWGSEQPPQNHHVYVKDIYLRSYNDQAYAVAIAKSLNGDYREYAYEPPYLLDDFMTLRDFSETLFDEIMPYLEENIAKRTDFQYSLKLHPVLLVQLLDWLTVAPGGSMNLTDPLTAQTAESLFTNIYTYFGLDEFSIIREGHSKALSKDQITTLIEQLIAALKENSN